MNIMRPRVVAGRCHESNMYEYEYEYISRADKEDMAMPMARLK